MRKNKKSGIYCIENIINNKKYIGQSVDIDSRWSKHKSELNKNSHNNDYLQKSWNKYGEENFKFYVLEYCNIDELDKKEVYYINLYDSLNKTVGYNMKHGGQNGGSFVSEEVRKKMSNSIKKFYEDNPHIKELRSINALRQWSNLETKKKIIGENNGMYGKHHTEEAKKKVSEANKGRPSWRRNLTPVRCIDLNQVFDCCAEAGKYFGIQSGSVLQCCCGKRKTAGGHRWEFINLENNIC